MPQPRTSSLMRKKTMAFFFIPIHPTTPMKLHSRSKAPAPIFAP